MADPKTMTRATRFGSLDHFEKGGVEAINDDPRNYAFSNVFEVASKSEPYEKVAVAKNLKYVLEAVRAEGTSPWYTAARRYGPSAGPWASLRASWSPRAPRTPPGYRA